MKRIIIWSSVVLVGCCFMVSPKTVNDRNDTISELKNETVAFVDVEKSDDGMTYGPYCTGVWITDKHILTAKHCVVAADPLLDILVEQNISVDLTQVDMEYVIREDIRKSRPQDVTARRAKSVAIDDFQDLAIVEVLGDIPDHPVATLAPVAPRDGEDVHIVGHTMRMYWTYLRGYVSATRSPIYDYAGNATKALQIASPAFKGNSGGGAFNESAELVGIMSWVSTQTPDMGFFIHRDEIAEFIRRSGI